MVQVGEILEVALSRTQAWDIPLYTANGQSANVGNNDRLRFKVATLGSNTPILDLTATPTANGSYIDFQSRSPARGILQLGQSDLISLQPATRYRYELIFIDAENPIVNAAMPIARGAFKVSTSIGGDIS